jgi:hypothetical protein
LLVAIPGGRNVEAFLHEKFRRDRKFGEWFAPSPELMDFIARVKAGDDPLDGVVVPAASPSKVRNVRVDDEEWERWRVLANGEPMSKWIRRALNEAVDSLEAERRRTEAQVQERKRLRDTAKQGSSLRQDRLRRKKCYANLCRLSPANNRSSCSPSSVSNGSRPTTSTRSRSARRGRRSDCPLVRNFRRVFLSRLHHG